MTDAIANIPPLVRMRDVAQVFPVGDDTIRRAVKRGELELIKRGPRISMVRSAQVLEWLEGRQ